MNSSPTQHPVPASNRLVAHPLHTVLVVALVALNAYRGVLGAASARAGLMHSRPQMYLRTIAVEIVFLGIVVFGVRLRGESLQALFGQRWKSATDMVRDVGLGLLLLVASTLLVSIIGGHQHGSSENPSNRFLDSSNRDRISSLVRAFCRGRNLRGSHLPRLLSGAVLRANAQRSSRYLNFCGGFWGGSWLSRISARCGDSRFGDTVRRVRPLARNGTAWDDRAFLARCCGAVSSETSSTLKPSQVVTIVAQN